MVNKEEYSEEYQEYENEGQDLYVDERGMKKDIRHMAAYYENEEEGELGISEEDDDMA